MMSKTSQFGIRPRDYALGLLFGWFPALAGFIALIFIFFLPEMELPPEVITLALLLSAFMSGVVLHEAAHYAVGRLVGLEPWLVQIGSGATLLDKQFPRCRLILKQFPYSGAVHPRISLEGANPLRMELLLMIAAGPASNLLVLGIAATILVQGEYSTAATVLWPVLIANAYLLIVTLIPLADVEAGVPHDGRQIWRLLFRHSSPTAIQTSASTSTQTPSAPSAGWGWAVKEMNADVLLDYYRTQLESDLTPAGRALALDAFATAVLMYGATEHLGEADRYSEELLKSRPDEWTVKGTRGSVLVEKGELSDGMAMLFKVMQHDPSVFDRAIAASFLALAELKRGNLDEAARWLECSRSLDPSCASLRRIERELVALRQRNGGTDRFRIQIVEDLDVG